MKSALMENLRWELSDFRQALLSWRYYRTLLLMAVGITISSIAINGLVIPQNLFASGVSGLSLMWFYNFGWPSLGSIYLLLNIPIFLLGWREYALRFVVLSMLGAMMLAFALDLTSGVRIRVDEPILACLLAGVMVGMGSGSYLRFGGSAGGADILASFIKKRFALPMGTTFNLLNGVNLCGALVIFGLESALYTAVFMWTSIYVLDRVQTGFSQRQAVYIITDKPDEVARQVMKRLDRGVTFFHATGGFSKGQELVVFSVINLSELGQLKALLYETDPKAFVVVFSTNEVIGHRFLSWEDEGYRRPPNVGK
ncbi:MAG: YitT family protein [Deltaproteobacteria bacterium]|nr:YitT family protein [Deltaproteobacteria bacterium]